MHTTTTTTVVVCLPFRPSDPGIRLVSAVFR
jgi:hypothetical protein